MPTPIGRAKLQDLLEADAQLVEVLPQAEYRAEHLPAAINIPLGELARRAPGELARVEPIVVYCHDAL
jgi:rhodanese-related sulfurtransferase